VRKPLVDVNDRRQLYLEYERSKRAAAHFEFVRTNALNGLPTLSPETREQVSELVHWLEAAIDELRKMPPPRDGRPDPRKTQERIDRCQASQRAIAVAVLTHAALTVCYGGDGECMSLYARTVLGLGTHFKFEIGGWRIDVAKVPVFSFALVERMLKHQNGGWRDAKDPLAYIATQCRRMASKEAKESAPLRFPSFETGTRETTLPLAETAEADTEPAKTDVTRVYTFDGFKDEARRRADLEVLAYIEGLEAACTLGLDRRAAHRQIRRQMGWNTVEAKKIRARFLRLRDQAAENTVRHHPALSDASCTVFFEPYYDAAQGRRHGGWTHKRAYPPPNPLEIKRK
jgi:hypothetical protein